MNRSSSITLIAIRIVSASFAGRIVSCRGRFFIGWLAAFATLVFATLTMATEPLVGPVSPALAESSPAPIDAAVREAIENLDSPSFSERERAARNLWSFGIAVEPALRKLVESDNLEARQRAAQILAEFDFGITPDVPPHLAKLYRLYRGGSAETRLQVFSTLIASGEFAAVQSLLKRATDRRTRHAVYTQSIESTPIMVGMIERDELDEWIEVMANDEFPQPRCEMVSKWLTSTGVLATLASQNDLSIVELAIAQEANDKNRYRLLRRLFVQREFTDFYSLLERLDLMLGYVDVLPVALERHELFIRFLSLARNPSLYDPEPLGKLIHFASTRGTDKTLDELWTYMIETILPRPEVESQMTFEQLKVFAGQLGPANYVRLRKSLATHSPRLARLLDSSRPGPGPGAP